MCIYFFSVFFFKQKTTYEMRISDWSSDVCSSDLPFDYVVKLSGTNIDDLYGCSTKGFDRSMMDKVYVEKANRDAFDEMNCRNLMVALTTGPLNVINRTYKSVSYLELPLSDDGRRASNTIEAVLPHEGGSRCPVLSLARQRARRGATNNGRAFATRR